MRRNHFCLLVSICLTMLVTSALLAMAQSNSGTNCFIGFEYQLSYNENWGANRPVILSVEPASPAAQAGLKPGDIIDSINGLATSEMDEAAFIRTLTNPTDEETRLCVSNFAYHRAERILPRYCLGVDMIDERQLSKAFSLYSLEDASERLVVYPFDTGREGKTSFEAYQAFAFADSQSDALNETDEVFKAVIKQAFERKGLRYDVHDADIIIDTYYKLVRNPFYKEVSKKDIDSETKKYYRVAPESGILTPMPLLEVGADKQAAPTVLTVGIRLFDGRNLSHMLWSCEAVEHIMEEYPIAEYARNALPIMLMQFPFVRYDLNPAIRVVSRRFNYTGIVYNARDISLVAFVVPGSPADRAGIKSGDRITAINGKMMDTKDALNKAYHSFVQETIRFRDGSTLYTDKYGLKNCRYWKSGDNKAIAKRFAKNKYKTVFSYLFNFRPYVSGNELPTSIVFDIVTKEGLMKQVSVMPEVRDASYYSLD